jgi:hypothetical protein
MANVVVAWQSVVGGSATTAKFNMPPFFGVWAIPGDEKDAAANSAANDMASLDLIGFLQLLSEPAQLFLHFTIIVA